MGFNGGFHGLVWLVFRFARRCLCADGSAFEPPAAEVFRAKKNSRPACARPAADPPCRAMKLRPLLLLSSFVTMFSLASAEPLKVGDAAPLVSGTTDAGATLNLGDVYKKNAYTLVWFYPRALTGGCTKQGCSLRDGNAELAQKGVAIIGVSNDPVEKQKEFKDVNHFPFPLLADTDSTVIKAFGQAGGTAKREAYLIKDGKIVYKDSDVTEQQAQNILKYLASVK
jgi:peroxiredoxin Q/BCP